MGLALVVGGVAVLNSIRLTKTASRGSGGRHHGTAM